MLAGGRAAASGFPVPVSSTTSSTYRLLRPLLFRLDPETAHDLAILALRFAGAVGLPGGRQSARLSRRLMGLEFSNPVGLAAGFDKNARLLKSFIFMHLGFAEVGTVTPLGQAGNPRPRMFRHVPERSLQNALGFNNEGLEAVRSRLEMRRAGPVPIAVNIGKNKATPDASAEEDYVQLVKNLSGCCDYFVLNVSSPNTPGLRDMQEAGRLSALVACVRGLTDRPMMIKLAPDLAAGESARLSEAAVEAGAAGVVVCNTTIDYELLPGVQRIGGLSGAVLKQRSFEALREVAGAVGGSAIVVSVGGIDSGAEAYRRLRAGADLVEAYSAMVFEGPGLFRRINRELLELMDRDGAETLDEVIGVDLR
jgi:dihydroorotate dehydrogenase